MNLWAVCSAFSSALLAGWPLCLGLECLAALSNPHTLLLLQCMLGVQEPL